MKKVLITGASSGIGHAITKRLLANNNSVVGIARTAQHLNGYYPYLIDFSETATLEQQFKSILRDHPDIDTVICSAGYGHFVELEQFSYAEMQKIMDVNFLSHALLIKLVLPLLKKCAGAKIIFIGSECALEGQKKGSLYCASKFALRGFVQSLQCECVSANLAITLINPGLVRTPFFDRLSFQPGETMDNAILPEQVAEMIMTVLRLENNCVMQEINCQPLKKVIQKK